MVIEKQPPEPAPTFHSSSSFPSNVTESTVPDLKFHSTDVDIEQTSNNTEADPFRFRVAFKTEFQLKELRDRRKGDRIAKFQDRQNLLIDSLLKPIEEHSKEADDEEEATRLPVKIAVWASLIANISLCVLQMYAAVSSQSLSLLATGIDSVFDIASNVMLFWLHKKAERLNQNRWPVGGARLETIGNVIYGFLMGSVNLVVVVESVRVLVEKSNNNLRFFHLPSIIAVASALVVKLFLFLYCTPLRRSSSQVRVLWEDHRNDLWINTFGILMSTGGSKLEWYLDPMGGIIIALGIIVAWARTVYGEFQLLAGKSASPDFIQLVVYKAITFSSEIEKIDTVRAYHSGPDYFVEVDIVVSPDTPLWKAHDIGQQLQDKIEELPSVGRAFVHIDYETTHTPEHHHLC